MPVSLRSDVSILLPDVDGPSHTGHTAVCPVCVQRHCNSKKRPRQPRAVMLPSPSIPRTRRHFTGELKRTLRCGRENARWLTMRRLPCLRPRMLRSARRLRRRSKKLLTEKRREENGLQTRLKPPPLVWSNKRARQQAPMTPGIKALCSVSVRVTIHALMYILTSRTNFLQRIVVILYTNPH